jgi:glycerophosphoryl diester phosphodiesterase
MILVANPHILVHGHRGARAARPENTLPAFAYAIERGADFVELDVAVTSDGVLVVSHDPRINRKLCRGPEGTETAIHKLTLAQVRAWDCGSLPNPEFPAQELAPGARIPTLAEVFDLVAPSRAKVNVEIKMDAAAPDLSPDPATFARLVVDEVRKHHMERRVIVQSFDFRPLKEVRRLAPELTQAALYAGRAKPFVEIAAEAGVEGHPVEIVAPHFPLVTAAEVRAAHAAGLQVVPWTVNKPEAWRTLTDAGVDAIISDDPAAVLAWLESAGLR